MSHQHEVSLLRTAMMGLLIAIAFTSVAKAHSQSSEPTPTNEHPVVQLDLRKFGYNPNIGIDLRLLQKFVAFIDNNDLAWAWVIPDQPVGSGKIPRSSDAAHLHVLVLNVKTGQKQAELELPTSYRPVCFLAMHDGRFLTCTGNKLRLYSPKFEILREQELPLADAFAAKISQDRRILLLSFLSGKDTRDEIREADSFASVQGFPSSGITDIASGSVVGTCGQPLQICVAGIDQNWLPLHPIGFDNRVNYPNYAAAVLANDNTVVMEERHSMVVTTVADQVLFQSQLPKDRSYLLPVVSMEGNRFAVIENRERGLTSEPLDMYPFDANDRALVYSIPDGRAIYAVGLQGTSPWTPWDIRVNELALSPDGNLLAVVSVWNGSLKIYRLPDANLPPH